MGHVVHPGPLVQPPGRPAIHSRGTCTVFPLQSAPVPACRRHVAHVVTLHHSPSTLG